LDKSASTAAGVVGISLAVNWLEPVDPQNKEDQNAAERARRVKLGWCALPVFKTGNYPDEVKQGFASVCSALGMDKKLPEFTPEEIVLNKGSADFFGLNTYSATLIRKPETFRKASPLNMIANCTEFTDAAWKQ
jgi:beta-glucosidase/6-phospho-beta-glucosidase/beta-galactosidase